MRIGWIGGGDRNEMLLRRIAAGAGHVLEFHSGHVGGQGVFELKAFVDRSDFLVIVTDVIGHGAVLLAKRLAASLGRRTFVVRRCSGPRFRALLEALAIWEGRLLVAS